MFDNKVKISIHDVKSLVVHKKLESYQSAVIIIILAAFLLISYNLINFIIAYRNVNIEAEKKANVISNLGELAVQEPLWDLDDDVIAKIANSLFYDKEVDSVKITSITGTVMFEKNNDVSSPHKTKDHVYSKEEIIKSGMLETGYMVTGQKLGTIEIGITKHYKRIELIKSFLTSVIMNLITLFLIYLAILAILNQEKSNRRRINSILDNMVDSVITINKELTIRSCNLATEKMFGFDTSEIVGSKFEKLISSEDENEIKIETLKSYNLNFNGLKKNGGKFPVEFNVGSILLENEQLFIIVVRDITIRKEVEKMKNEFISTVSHELRTPLTSIKGSLALLKSGAICKLPPEVIKLLTIADNNSSRLINLINDILDIERIESGKMNFSIKPSNLVSIIKESIESTSPYASQFNVNLAFLNDFENISVLADKQRIIQVLSNLISNAIKFSTPNQTVEISLEKTDATVKVSIKDNGLGISDDYKDKLFQKFFQIDSSDTREKGGTGLGLSICKAIIEKHKGIISFDSTLNEGSTFYFELPLYDMSTDSSSIEVQNKNIL